MFVLTNLFARVRDALRSRAVANGVESEYDPYENTPMRREDLDRLFEINSDPQQIDGKANAMRDSEKLERETMSMIRGALYVE